MRDFEVREKPRSDICNPGRIRVHEDLSRRERAVLAELGHGMSNKEISVILGISARTVQKHLQRIYRHLGVQTRAEAIVQLHERAGQSKV